MSKAKYQLKLDIIISAMLHVILFAVLIWSKLDLDTNDQHIDASAELFSIYSVQQVPGKTEKQAAVKTAVNKQAEVGVIAKTIRTKDNKFANTSKTNSASSADINTRTRTARKTAVNKQAEVGVIAKTIRTKDNKFANTSKTNSASSADINTRTRTARKTAVNKQAEVGVIAKTIRTKDNKFANTSKTNSASSADINSYAWQIKSAIESSFYDISSYVGKHCTLRLKLAKDGTLLDLKYDGGDLVLCSAAQAAARQAKIPKPPSQGVYEVFKNALLEFKPE